VRAEYGADGRARRLRVRPELVRVAPGVPPVSAWQDAFDADVADVFQVQTDIAGRVATALNLALAGGDRARLAERPTADLDAYDAFLRGEDAWNGGGADLPALRRAMAAYSQAVALDPRFVRAWVQLSRATAFLHANAPDPALAARALAAAERARALAPRRPETRLAFGDYHLVTGDPARALEELTAGLRLAPDDPGLITEAARTARVLGRWDEAARGFRRASEIDPRTPLHAARLGSVLLYQRRPAEAARALDHALALAPGNATYVHTRALVALSLGDLPAARRVLDAGAAAGGASRIVAHTANYWGFWWMLDERQAATLLTLGPDAFDDDRGRWALARAFVLQQRGDTAAALAWADSARAAFAVRARERRDEPEPHVRHALALALLGRREAAVDEARRAVALRPLSRDAYEGPYYLYQLARVLTMTGDRAGAAAQLAELLRVPSLLTPGWLAIDPTFAVLRGEPAFDALLADARRAASSAPSR
jgi:tetratricopeptide (TPR) repeat protein